MKRLLIFIYVLSNILWAQHQELLEFSINDAENPTDSTTHLGYSSKSGMPFLPGPSSITVNESGNLYILDSHNRRILKYALDKTISIVVQDIEIDSAAFAFNLFAFEDILIGFFPTNRISVFNESQVKTIKLLTPPGVFIEGSSFFRAQDNLFYVTNTGDLYLLENILGDPTNPPQSALPKKVSQDIRLGMEESFSPTSLPHLRNYINYYNYWVQRNENLSSEEQRIAQKGIFNMYAYTGEDSEGNTYWADYNSLYCFNSSGRFIKSMELTHKSMPIQLVTVSLDGIIYGLAYDKSKAFLLELQF